MHTSSQGTGVTGQSGRTERVEKGPVILTRRKQDRHRYLPGAQLRAREADFTPRCHGQCGSWGDQLAGEEGVSAPSFPSLLS